MFRAKLNKMNQVIILCIVASLTAAAVIPDESKAEIVKYKSSNDGAGSYKFSYETSNGITREESGHLVNIGNKDEHMVVEGFYSYTDVEGKEVVVNYTADENGFHIGPDIIDNILPPHLVATFLGK